jgi:hypothetical protein
MKAVRIDDYGGVEVLDVRGVARPQPGPDQVLVAVRAAGINPSEGKMREPSEVPWEVAGSLFVAGATGVAAVRAVAPPAPRRSSGARWPHPLHDVRAAFAELEAGHTAGKIVLIPNSWDDLLRSYCAKTGSGAPEWSVTAPPSSVSS